MRRLVGALLLATMAAAVWGAEAEPPDSSAIERGTADFDRNVALGAILDVRPGAPAELAELQVLADRGLKQARDLVASHPDSANAHYLLGSWLLYAYRVVEIEQITFDTESGARAETVRRAVQGLVDDPAEGLQALSRAAELAPEKGEYLLDLAAALFDFGRTFEAQGILKGIWADEPELEAEHKVQAALLLSSIAEADEDLADAREWIYAALSLDPVGARVIEHLRRLDAAEAVAGEEATAAAVEGALQQAYAEQYEDVEAEYYDEDAYDEQQMEYDEAYEEE
jgi:hypothetical protein